MSRQALEALANDALALTDRLFELHTARNGDDTSAPGDQARCLEGTSNEADGGSASPDISARHAWVRGSAVLPMRSRVLEIRRQQRASTVWTAQQATF